MNEAAHTRAEHLIAQERVEGIPARERDWLAGHLEQCARCAEVAETTERALRSLRAVSVQVDPRLVQRTRSSVHLRAEELRRERAHLWVLWVSCALSWLLGAASAPLVWRGFEWLGRELRVPALVSQMGFLLWWAVPGIAVAAVVGWYRSHAAGESRHALL